MATESPRTSFYSGHERVPTTPLSLPTPSPRCRQCGSRQEDSRNLIVCIDGTSNKFGQNNTNVVKLFAKINLESVNPKQCAYYSSGIGARPESLHILERMGRAASEKFDMAIAWNMEEIVKDAYSWLARTYQKGDQIYLFGFSRGAYQVRVLAGMIHEVGLIRTPTEKQIGTAYGHYEAIRSRKAKTRQNASEFKSTFSWKDLRVHFVGVWDTVSSVGLIRGDVFLSTSSSAAHACHFRHALALDEFRVKFMPEYFHEINALTDDGKYSAASRDIVDAPTDEGERRLSIASDNGSNFLGDKRTTEIKEVWFAGSHSDVGGQNRPGKSHLAGNVSLLWMRREAAANGLVLLPTDIVWVPDDLDFGTNNSMNFGWGVIEYIPIKHQVAYSAAGGDARRRHKLQPRRLIPGQKVHASILCANEYEPQARLGEGFDIPITHAELEDMELDGQFWETGLFDDSAAAELLTYLCAEEGVARIHLDRLLFMLRFREGRQYVRNVSDWQTRFLNLINDSDAAPLVRLLTLVAYYEASNDLETLPTSPALPEPSEKTFDDAKNCLSAILTVHKHQDGPRVVALLRPLTKHQVLRKRILTEDVLKTLVGLLDKIVQHPKDNFSQAMHGLNYLLQCEDTQQFLIDKFKEVFPGSDVSRLSRILEVNDPRLLNPALRMVLTLARIPEAKSLCSEVKPRLTELARRKERLVGLLAVEVSLALYNPRDQDQLDIHDAHVRANLATALVRLNPDGHSSNDRRHVDPGQQIFRDLFGLNSKKLSEPQKKLIGELKKAAWNGNARERTAATMTLLKLCETKAIRTFLREISLLDVFIDQLERQESALLAAFALAVCLKHDDMKESIKDNELLPGRIVKMLEQDYFDDAVGHIEGFQIFEELMQDADLRERIKSHPITKILDTKLGKGKPKGIRTGLISLDIFRSFNPDGPWIGDLVKNSLEYLESPTWKTQKAGVTILSALAQTDHGVAAIKPHIAKIIEMLLPGDFVLIPPTTQGSIAATPSRSSESQAESRDTRSSTALDAPRGPPSWMMGPVCALRILARNKTLRDCARKTRQYADLKDLYQSGALVGDGNTRAWQINIPNRTDVTYTLERMIKVIDGELSEDGLMSVRDTMLPHIQHWDRLVTMLGDRAMEGVVVLPVLLGVSAIAILTATVLVSVHMSERAFQRTSRWMHRSTRPRWVQSASQTTRGVWDNLRSKLGRGDGGHGASEPASQPSVPVQHVSESPLGRHGGEMHVVAARQPGMPTRREMPTRRARSEGFLLGHM